MSFASRIRDIAALRHYSPQLRPTAAHTLTTRRALRRDLAAQPEWQRMIAAGRFSQVFTAEFAHYWWGAFKDHRREVKDYLELGSWEGQSLVLAGWLFPEAKLTAVDWFSNPQAVANFRHNTAPFQNRLKSVCGTSWEVLARWATADNPPQFDVIFIDSDHRFDGVLLDSALAWQLLRVGGYMVWDDYLWADPQVKPLYPKPAMDAFLKTRAAFYEPVWADWQVCVRKISPDPQVQDMARTMEVKTA
jgi:hypothetical protein